jgi:hypothetical protein
MRRHQSGHDRPHVSQAAAAAAGPRCCCLVRLRSLFLFRLARALMIGPGRQLARGAAVRHGRAARTRLERHTLLGLTAALAAQNYLRLLQF